jgi:hypothetical protein
MANYILRDLPPDIWTRAKDRAQREGWPLRALFLRLLEDFGAGRVTPSGPPPPLNRYGRLAENVFPPSVTQEPSPAPLLGPPPPPLPLPANRGPRQRAVVITFRNQEGQLRLTEAAYAREQDDALVIFDAQDRQVGRIALSGIESWFVNA